jgi:hypothetical protein
MIAGPSLQFPCLYVYFISFGPCSSETVEQRFGMRSHNCIAYEKNLYNYCTGNTNGRK